VLASEKETSSSESSSSLRNSTKSLAERFEGPQIRRTRDMVVGGELSPGDEESPHDDIMEREQSSDSFVFLRERMCCLRLLAFEIKIPFQRTNTLKTVTCTLQPR